MSISIKELRENNYCLSSSRTSSSTLSELIHGADKHAFNQMFDVLKDIEHLLIDEDRLFFSRLFNHTNLSLEIIPIMYVYRENIFKIKTEKLTGEDNYLFNVEYYDKSIDNYKDGISFNSDKKSCINWLTKVLIDGSFILEVI